MSPNRRDILKLAAGLGLAGTVPTMAERLAAAEILDQHSTGGVMENPAMFADEAGMTVSGHLDGWFDSAWWAHVCPEDSAAERKALKAFEREWPGVATGRRNTFWHYQEAVFSLAIAMYTAGLRHGATYENLRRTVVGDVRQCRPCWGTGIDDHGQDCPACGGAGLVRSPVN